MDSTRDEPKLDPEKKRLLPNAAFAVLQVIVASVTLFLLYRFLIASQGIEALGVWSLVVGATSLASVSNLGLAGGTVRFVSKYRAHNDDQSAAQAVETSTLSIAILMGAVALMLWPASEWLLKLVVPDKWLGVAHDLVPYTLAGLWLNSIGGAIYSGLDGCHRADRRSLATIVTQPLLLILALWLVPNYGLKGLAGAQILQYLVWLALGWLILRKELPTLSRIPRRWSKSLFLEMWRYGLSFQAISILLLFTEPLAKGLLSHYGSLSAVGLFEMANRLVSQVRSLLVSANQVIIPYYSKVGETSRESVKTIYEKHLHAIILLSCLIFSALVGFLPMIAVLWIGRLEWQFLVFSLMLAVGAFASLLAVPAYSANLGLGRLSHNLFSHAVIAVTVAIFGVVGGIFGGALGSAAAMPLSFILSTVTLLVAFHRAESISVRVVFSATHVKAILIGAVIAVAGYVPFLLVMDRSGVLLASLASVAFVAAGWAAFVALIPEAKALVQRLRSWRTSKPDLAPASPLD